MKHSALQLAAHLCRALRQRDEAMVAALLQEGANPNLVLPEGVAAMHLAAGLEQEDGIRQHLLRLLLQHGGDPNVRSAEGLTPLHVAASWGRTACLRLLLAEGGDPHLEDQDGSTAIDLAVEQGYERCVSILQDEKWNGGFSYSPELTSSLETYRIPNSRADEMALAAEFDQPDKSRRWREGLLKSSFNYLLLDPRVTQNLPARCQLLSSSECFRTFIQAIFYVGKGTRRRPYRHLYEALTHHREGQGAPARSA